MGLAWGVSVAPGASAAGRPWWEPAAGPSFDGQRLILPLAGPMGMGRVSWAVAIALAAFLAGCAGGSPGVDGTGMPGAGTGPGAASGSGASQTENPDPIVIDVGQGKGGIDGVVVTETITPIQGALVILQPLNVSAITDADGQFIFDGLEPGAYVVNVTHKDYKPAQATADVTTGKPAAVKLTLAAVRNLDPHVVAHSETLLVSSAFCIDTYCNKVFSGNSDDLRTHDRAYMEVDDQPTAFQVEVSWDATVATLGDNGLIECTVFGDDPEGSTVLVRYTQSGPSPLALRMPGTWLDEDSGATIRPNGVTCELFNANGDVPVSLMLQQQAELYAHFFYNFLPDEGWTFVGDGEHPVPP